MATRIRLRRVGRKGQPSYRIVVAEHTTPRDGRFIATLGNYNPRPKDAVISVNAEKVKYWLEKGATPTDTVRSLLKKAGVYGGAERTGKASA
jgi:small subunit ribosomal protein S16